MRPGKFVAVAGNIGVGKSMITTMIGEVFGWQMHFEPVINNPYLDDYYKDMARWSFHLQVYFLSKRFEIQKAIMDRPGSAVQDRTIYEDAEIFATALHQMRKISKRDWETYQGFYHAILDAIRPPDLMIYLKCSMRTLRERIRLRGRKMEQDVPPAYLKRLERLYDGWIGNYRMSEVLVLETDRLDYIHDLVHRLDVMERIEAVLPDEIGRPACR